MNKKKDLYIFGGRSTAVEIYYSAYLMKLFSNIFFVVEDNFKSKKKNFLTHSNFFKNINRGSESFFIVSMTNYKIKKKCIDVANKYNLKLISVIHPKSYICESAKIGNGVYVAANSVISSGANVNDNCIINYGVVVGHNSNINKFCVLNPGVVIGGNSEIGNNVLIGANSFVKQGLTISDHSKIDALTYVYFNVKKYSYCTSRNTKIINK